MNQKWRPFFPLPSPRREQEVVLDRIVEMIDGGEKTILLEAGTGVGKSAIAVCVANYVSSLGDRGDYQAGAYILTSQKILQDQYIADFPQAADIRSSANFSCHSGPGENCGQTSRYMIYRQKGEERGPSTCPGCPYRAAKEKFINAPLGVTNYSYFLSETVYAGKLSPRELLILDEAHNIESEMRRWSTVEIDEETSTRIGCTYPYGSSRVNAIDWMVHEYRPAVQRYILAVQSKLESLEKKGVKRGMNILIDELDKMDRHICSLNRALSDEGDVNYDMLVDWDEERSGRRKLRVQPLDSGQIAKDILYPLGKRVLLMSATVLNDSVFRKASGLTDAGFISCPTPFPAEHFGIVYRPVGRMAKAHIQKTMPKMVRAVKDVLSRHKGEKGIIHCSNYDVTKAIGSIGDKRLLIQTSAKDREEMLKKHFSSREPTVLVSPSMMEGLDLDGDLGRFQVICKVPFPNMGDPIVEAKNRSGDEWYAWVTARTLIQAVGRCVRSMDDTTHTYILDESFGNFVERWTDLFPHYFTEMEIELE